MALSLGLGLGLSQVRGGGGVPFARTAAILGAGGLDYALFDWGLSSSLFQDAAGTTPSALGNPVGRWNARQKAPHFASQPVNASRPVLQADGLKGDGSDDSLLTDWLAQSADNCIIVQALIPASFTGTRVLAGAEVSGGHKFWLAVDSDGKPRAAVGGANSTPYGNLNLLGKEVVMCLTSGGAFYVQDEIYSTPIVTPLNVPVALRIGARTQTDNSGAAYFPGWIKRAGLGRVMLTPEQFQQIRAEWLAAA